MVNWWSYVIFIVAQWVLLTHSVVNFLFLFYCLDTEECSPLLAEYFRTKKMLDDAVEEDKPSKLVFEITNDDGFCVRARSCDGNAGQIFQF